MIMSRTFFSAIGLKMIVILSTLTSTCISAAPSEIETFSKINDDEFMIFFRTAASMDDTQKYWEIPIHGWIYEPQDSTVRKSLIANAINLAYDLEADKTTQENFDRRVNLLVADNQAGKQIVIHIAGKTFALPPSSANGHFHDTIILPAHDINKFVKKNRLTYTAVTSKDEKRKFNGEVALIPSAGISIISDIDDTIKVSEVTNHKALFNYTFYQDFVAVPGMADLFQSWSHQQAMIHFVSSSPWHLYTPLEEFTTTRGFPWATFNLKLVRLKDETLLNLFKNGLETKPKQIEPILNTYPKRKFVLVGDSGEQDPEVYASLIRKYPQQILKIYIRNVTDAFANDSRFSKVFQGIDKRHWQLFTDPSNLSLPKK